MKNIIINGKCMTNRETVHLYLKAKLDIKDYYGNNLDALWDALSDYDIKIKICLINKETLINELNGYGQSIIDLFNEVSKENNNILFKVIKNELTQF